MRYSLDLSALLDGWRRYYPPEVFPGIWTRLEDLIDRGDLRATDEIRIELGKKDDEVLAWAMRRRESLFVPIDEEIQLTVRQIIERYPKLIDTRSGRSGADPFVIALAKIQGCPVVTGEAPTHRENRPNIPDVCWGFGVRPMSFLELLREQGWTF